MIVYSWFVFFSVFSISLSNTKHHTSKNVRDQSNFTNFFYNKDYNIQTNLLNACPNSTIGYYALDKVQNLKARGCPRQSEKLLVPAVKFINLFNVTFCNQNIIQDTCLNSLRSFMKTQTGNSSNNATWKTLVTNFNPASIEINQSLDPCLFFALYEKIFYSYRNVVNHLPFCSSKNIYCIEGVFTWNNILYK